MKMPVVTYPSAKNVSSLHYDDETLILKVTFRNGGVYEYFDVTKATYLKLVECKEGISIDKNLSGLIIKAGYKYNKVVS
jgi:hypothetical protein